MGDPEKSRTPWQDFINQLPLEDFEGEPEPEEEANPEISNFVDYVMSQYKLEGEDVREFLFWITNRAKDIKGQVSTIVVDTYANVLLIAAAESGMNARQVAWICFLYGIAFGEIYKFESS